MKLILILIGIVLIGCRTDFSEKNEEDHQFINNIMEDIVIKTLWGEHKINLIDESLPHNKEEITAIIDSVFDISNEDAKQLKSKMDSMIYFFQIEKLSVNGIKKRELDSLSLLKDTILILNDSTIYEFSSSKEIVKKYGEGWFYYYSLPLWNKDTTVCIIKQYGHSLSGIASAEYYHFTKNSQRKWILKESKSTFGFNGPEPILKSDIEGSYHYSFPTQGSTLPN